MHYHTSEGELTTSDHLPIIIRLSTNPILIKTPNRLNFEKTDWNKFKEDTEHRMEEELTREQNKEQSNKREIDESFSRWMEIIKDEISKNTPTINYTKIRNYRDSDLLKAAKMRFKKI